MSDPDTQERIRRLIAEYRPGWSLAQPFYNDPDLFRVDMERIFHRRWIYAGHTSRIPNCGDHFLFNLGGESLIITRGREGEVHALFNVCRHRGSRICLEEQGSAKALVCPYHSWTYGLDGKLLAARGLPADLDRGQFGLRRCHVRVLEGLIYVCLAEDPPDLASFFQAMEPFLEPFDLAHTKTAARTVWTVEANWKLVLENFIECYHCGPAHPEYCSVMASALPASFGEPSQVEEFQSLTRTWEAETRRKGRLPDPVSGPDYSLGRVPIREGFLTQSRDGRPVAPLLGNQTDYDGGYTGTRLYPCNYLFGSNDHVVIPRFTPVAPTRTDVEFSWLVRADAVEGKDYDPEALTWVWTVTTQQDKTIVTNNQAGVNSRAYQPGPYTAFEQNLPRLLDWYLKQISS